jgi:hypothetical protein
MVGCYEPHGFVPAEGIVGEKGCAQVKSVIKYYRQTNDEGE